jgi:subtilisin family serine protease
VRVALTLSFLLLAVLAPAAQAAPGETRIIVGRDPGLSGRERADIRRDAGVDLVRTLGLPNTEVVTTADPQAALADLRKNPDVRYAELDRVRHALTNDTYFSYQWAIENTGQDLLDSNLATVNGTPDADMDVTEAWARGATGSGVTVAVVDSGIDAAHPDLAGQVAAGSRGFVGAGDAGFVDGEGHGTHVSGIIAAVSGNAAGVSGLAPSAKVMALKALDDTGAGVDSDIAEAFDFAGSQNIPIVNASLGGEGASTTLTNAILRHPGTLYVIAAGNGGADGVGDDNDSMDLWPCNAPAANIVCVGSSTKDDASSSFSNFGHTTVDLFAPGQDILSTYPGDYAIESGTSMASPAVAAEAALVLSASPNLSTTQLKGLLLQTTDPKPAFAGRSVTGGRANANAAVGTAMTTEGDLDGDGLAGTADHCPTIAGPGTADGCPAPAVASTPIATPTATVNTGDADGDGRADALDLCPALPAATTTGCPVPGLRSLTIKLLKVKHRVKITVRTTRSASVTVTVERRVCQGKACRWRKAYSDAKLSKGNAAAFSTRTLPRGRYRVAVKLASPAGKAKPVRKSFKV